LLSAEQLAFLESCRVGHLATVDSTGQPHVVPVCFACRGAAVYTPIDQKPKRGDPLSLRRVRNLLAHPAVCLTVDRYDEDWSRLAWLQVRGRAELVDDPAERADALAALRRRYRQYVAMELESRPLIRLSVAQVVAWSASPVAR
jgi:coenzyme F420-0:L-glutamate ligase / coenzyme F420-1:gamma-L-glutamate ligase